MREYVEIGRGREARKTWHLEEISVVPARRTRSSKDVDTSWHIDAYDFRIPVLNHPTDALADVAFAKEMGAQGGLGVINAEGLIGRHEDMDAALRQITQAYEQGENSTKVLQQLHAEPIDIGLLRERIQELRNGDSTVSVRVSPQHARELAPELVKAGAEILLIQGTIISAEHVAADGDSINLKDFIGSLEVPVIAGGVSDASTALHLMRTGAAGIIIGSGYTTNEVSLGIETPLATAIADAAAVRREYMDETGGRYVHVIADGGLMNTGNVVKAIALGADAVMLGYCLAGATEAAASGYYWQSSAAHPHFPRGQVEAALDDSTSLETLLWGPSTDPYGGRNIIGGLSRAMAKCGYTDLKSFQKVELTV